MADPYLIAGLIHAGAAIFTIRKFVIYHRRRDEGEMAIPIIFGSLFGLPLLVLLWPVVWFIAVFCWVVGLITIPEAITKFRELRKELG